MGKYRKYILISLVIGLILAGVSLVRYKPLESCSQKIADAGLCELSLVDGERGFPVIFPDPFAFHYGYGINIFLMQMLGFSANVLVYTVMVLFLIIIYRIVLKQ